MKTLYKTKDLGEAGALVNQNVKLVRLKYSKEDFYYFVFEDARLAEAIAHTYWFGNLIQNVKKYYESLQALKDIIFYKKSRKGRTVSVDGRH